MLNNNVQPVKSVTAFAKPNGEVEFRFNQTEPRSGESVSPLIVDGKLVHGKLESGWEKQKLGKIEWSNMTPEEVAFIFFWGFTGRSHWVDFFWTNPIARKMVLQALGHNFFLPYQRQGFKNRVEMENYLDNLRWEGAGWQEYEIWDSEGVKTVEIY